MSKTTITLDIKDWIIVGLVLVLATLITTICLKHLCRRCIKTGVYKQMTKRRHIFLERNSDRDSGRYEDIEVATRSPTSPLPPTPTSKSTETLPGPSGIQADTLPGPSGPPSKVVSSPKMGPKTVKPTILFHPYQDLDQEICERMEWDLEQEKERKRIIRERREKQKSQEAIAQIQWAPLPENINPSMSMVSIHAYPPASPREENPEMKYWGDISITSSDMEEEDM